ncbi:DJ-1/PfpI family protein [Sphingomonas lenta]|uniref:Thiamine biosynthesis protein ThiJ n=1 Tax=Sphingomonas lenta TaxID=1141887 RepID=A0A2A2SFZ8_9SPHN|nr:DJ-1/PfpI family protein [Sphingomonas lenta]PAX08132.1 thiamine biosynthesis protein ThiJ [Sphingomonas lenta]
MDELRVAFLLFPNVTQLDLTGPAQVLSRLGNARIDLVWRDAKPVATDAGFSILPTATFADVPAADILCVPGGIGVADVIADDEAIGWVERVGRDARWVTSVCTGSLILGGAGLLQGYRAATHWAWMDMLPLFGAEPVAERVVVDRNRVTGGGVTAGIDFALTLMAQVRGEAHARLVQLSLEYNPQPPFDSGSPERAGEELVAQYRRRAHRIAPNREAELRAAADRRGRAGPGSRGSS